MTEGDENMKKKDFSENFFVKSVRSAPSVDIDPKDYPIPEEEID